MIIFTQTNDDIELKQAFNVRTQVFIEEQGISRDEEWDGLDSHATQFIAKNGDAPAVQYAYACQDGKLLLKNTSAKDQVIIKKASIHVKWIPISIPAIRPSRKDPLIASSPNSLSILY
jgi:hypothetical protein